MVYIVQITKNKYYLNTDKRSLSVYSRINNWKWIIQFFMKYFIDIYLVIYVFINSFIYLKAAKKAVDTYNIYNVNTP